MGIPFEIITMLGSTILGGLMSLWSQSIKAKQAQQAMLMERAKFQAETVKDAREYENVGFQWTRRIIALTAIFSIVVFPKVVAVFFPEVSVTVGYTEFRPGFFFVPEKEVMAWKQMYGLVITPLDTNLVGAIVGMYFGGSLVKK
tara:strand:+ start:726 stop:1157 length:432 start_codon:yes stop_codon:yes gene_type:complete